MLLTIKSVATLLAVKPSTLYSWVTQGKIPALKINGVIRFDEREIRQWLEKCCVPIGSPCMSTGRRLREPTTSVDVLIEQAKRAVYTSRGETRPIASPFRKEEQNGTR